MVGATLLRRLGPARTFASRWRGSSRCPWSSCAISAGSGEVVLTVARAVDGLGLGIAAVVATSLGTSGAPRAVVAWLRSHDTAAQLGTAVSIACSCRWRRRPAAR